MHNVRKVMLSYDTWEPSSPSSIDNPKIYLWEHDYNIVYVFDGIK